MSKGNWTNRYSLSADALLFGTTSVPIGTGTLTNGYVLTYNAGTLSLSPTAAGPTNPLSDVLLAGNTTGASNIVISSPQQITYAGGITIASSSANSNIIIGPSATSTALANGLSVGAGAQSSATGASSFGANANASGTNAFALGASSTASGTDSLGLGNGASTAGFASSVALGPGATNTAANQIMLGTNAFSVVNLGSLSFSTGLAVGNTTNLLTLPKIAGTPSGAASSGSLAYDSTNNRFYGRTNAAWVQLQTGAAVTPTLSAVLVAGNSTGANNISVAGNQSMTFINGVKIGSDGIDPLPGLSTTAVMIGRGTGNTISGNVINSTCVGWSATCSGSNATVFGTSASSAAGGVAVGKSATVAATTSLAVGDSASVAAGCTDAVVVGSGAFVNGTSTGCTVVGKGANVNGLNIQNVAIGTGATLNSGCNNSVLIGASSTQTAGIANTVAIGQGITIAGNNTITIGCTQNSGGDNCITIGRANTISTATTGSVFLGNNQSDTRALGNVKNVLLGDSTNIPSGAVTTRCAGIMPGTVIVAGSTDKLFGSVAFASGSSAAGTTLSVDANGLIHPNTSSIRYKQDVQPLRNPERILNLRAVDYAMKNSIQFGMTCGCPEWLDDPETGESIRNPCDGLHSRDVGMIAEEVANAGMEDFVVFAPDPDDPSKRQCRSIKYDRLVGPLIEVVKMQRDMLEDYQRRLEALESKMALAFGM